MPVTTTSTGKRPVVCRLRPAPPIAMAAIVLLSACGTTLFKADFEADVVGMRPSSSPAGDPTGDMIRVWIADPGNLVVIANGITGKSLRYAYQPSLSQVNFIGIETSGVPPEFWAAWTGRAEGFNASTPDLNFTVGNLNIGTAQLEIVDGAFVASGERLGAVVQGEAHTVVMHVDAVAGTYTVAIFQARGSNLTSGTRSLDARGRIPGDRVFDIAMFYDVVPSITNQATYIIDDILITRDEPGMP